jgi:hypothetical protein
MSQEWVGSGVSQFPTNTRILGQLVRFSELALEKF